MIYNGVDRDLYSPEPSRPGAGESSGAGDGPVILFVGRLVPKKGLQHLIAAFPRILEALPDARCIVVGGSRLSDTYGSQLRALVEQGGLSARFSWLQDVPEDELPAIYAQADICVFPSEGYESLPTVVFEAMACGVPVVATNRWGTPEALGTDHPGLVPEADPKAIARVVVEITSNSDLSEEVRAQQLSRVSHFDLLTMVSAHEALYRDVVAA